MWCRRARLKVLSISDESLGVEGKISEFGIPPPHHSEKNYTPVDRNYHTIREYLTTDKAVISIGKSSKVYSRYNCYKRHGEPWDFKEIGDPGYIRHRTGKFLCLIRESLGLPYLVGVADRYEEA